MQLNLNIFSELKLDNVNVFKRCQNCRTEIDGVVALRINIYL